MIRDHDRVVVLTFARIDLQGGTTNGSNAPPVSVGAQYGVSAVENSLTPHKRDFYLICMQTLHLILIYSF